MHRIVRVLLNGWSHILCLFLSLSPSLVCDDTRSVGSKYIWWLKKFKSKDSLKNIFPSSALQILYEFHINNLWRFWVCPSPLAFPHLASHREAGLGVHCLGAQGSWAAADWRQQWPDPDRTSCFLPLFLPKSKLMEGDCAELYNNQREGGTMFEGLY